MEDDHGEPGHASVRKRSSFSARGSSRRGVEEVQLGSDEFPSEGEEGRRRAGIHFCSRFQLRRRRGVARPRHGTQTESCTTA